MKSFFLSRELLLRFMNVKAVRQICLWTALSRAKSTVSSATSTIDIHVNLHANRSLGGEHREHAHTRSGNSRVRTKLARKESLAFSQSLLRSRARSSRVYFFFFFFLFSPLVVHRRCLVPRLVPRLVPHLVSAGELFLL